MRLALGMFSLFIAMAALGSVAGAQTQDRSWLGADPGYGMRSWEHLYPGLNLTPEQKRELADIRTETHRQVCAARDDLSVGPQGRVRRISEARRAGRERELAVLTEEQRQHMQKNPPPRSPLFNWQNRGERVQNPAGRRVPAPRNSAGLVPGVTDLSDEQTNRIAAIRQDTQRRVQEVQRNRALTPQQRSARIQQIQREGHDRVLSVLTPAQRRQFDEAMRSRPPAQPGSRGGAGPRGPGQPAHPGHVPGVTSLNPEQLNAIAAIRAEARQQIQAVQQDRSLTPQQRSARIQEIQRRSHDRVMAVLTEDQRGQFQRWWSARGRR